MPIANERLIFGLQDEEKTFNLLDTRYHVVAVVSQQPNSVLYKAVAEPYLSLTPSPSAIQSIPQFLVFKVIPSNSKNISTVLSRAIPEANALQRINNSHVIKCYGIHSELNYAYVALEYIDGFDFVSIINHKGSTLGVVSSLRYIYQALRGLEATHNAGIIHRDIKPGNIMLTVNGRVKLIDYCLAQCPGEKLQIENNNAGLGSFEYLAPECLNGEPHTTLSDIYSMGISLYHLLTGHTPFISGSIAQQVNNKVEGKFSPLRKYIKVPNKKLDHLIQTALQPNPKDRYQSARDFQSAIEQVLLAIGQNKQFSLFSLKNFLISFF